VAIPPPHLLPYAQTTACCTGAWLRFTLPLACHSRTKHPPCPAPRCSFLDTWAPFANLPLPIDNQVGGAVTC